MMYIISREYHFSAAHRIEGHPKCGRLHGHNYTVVVYVSGPLDEQGMVIDYGVLDDIVKPAIDTLDHRYIVSQDNIERSDPYADIAFERHDAFAPVMLKASTAEELAKYLYFRLAEHINSIMFLSLTQVVVCETVRSSAVFKPDA